MHSARVRVATRAPQLRGAAAIRRPSQLAAPVPARCVVVRAAVSERDLAGLKVDDLMDIARKKGVSLGRNATKTDLLRSVVRAGVSVEDLPKDLRVKLGGSAASPPRFTSPARYTPPSRAGSSPARAASPASRSSYNGSASNSSGSSGVSQRDLETLKVDDLMEIARKKGLSLGRNATKSELLRAVARAGVSVEDLPKDLRVKLGGSPVSPPRFGGAPTRAASPVRGAPARATPASYATPAASGSVSESDLASLKVDDLTEVARKKGVSVGRSSTKSDLVRALSRAGVTVADLPKDVRAKFGGGASTAAGAPVRATSPLRAAAPSRGGSSGGGSLSESQLSKLKVDDLTQLARKLGVAVGRAPTKTDVARAVARAGPKTSDLTPHMLSVIGL